MTIFLAIIGPLTGAVLISCAAILVGWGATRAVAKFETLLGFNQRFHRIIYEMYRINRRYRTSDPKGKDIYKEDAHELYRQFFALMLDQFTALRHGMLAREQMVEWMIWRVYAYKQIPGTVDRSVADVPYKEAWDRWSTQPPFTRHEGVAFLEEIHGCDKKNTNDLETIRDDVKAVVRKSRPSPFARTCARLLPTLQWLTRAK